MKRNLFSFLLAIALAMGVLVSAVVPCRADWVLDKVEFSRLSLNRSISYNGAQAFISPQSPPVQTSSGTLSASDSNWNEGGLDFSASASVSVTRTTSAPAGTSLSLSVTPIYKWVGNTPSSGEFFTRERGHISVYRSHNISPGNGAAYYPYTQAQPYTGHNVQITRAFNGFDDFTFGPNDYRANIYYAAADNGRMWSVLHGYSNGWYSWQPDGWRIRKWVVGAGQTVFRAQTRQIAASVKLAAMTATGDQTQSLNVSLRAMYKAEVCPFSLDLQTAYHVATIVSTPTYKYHIAEADRAWKGTGLNDPIALFWDGKANYQVSGATLLSTLGEPRTEIGLRRFNWWVTQPEKPVNHVVKPWDIFGEPPLPPNPTPTPAPGTPAYDEVVVEPSTQAKRFHHDVGIKSGSNWQWPQTTTTRVKIIGSGPNQPIVARAKVAWYPGPKTRFKTEMDVDVIDLDSGAVTPFAQMGAGGSADPDNPEEADIDAYIKEINAAKDQTFETGKALVEGALTAQMIVGSWYVPDLVADELTGQVNPLTFLPMVGKVVKAVKVLRVLDRAVGVANKLGPKSLRLVQRLRPEGKFVLRIRVRAIKIGKPHALPPGLRDADEEVNGLLTKKTCWSGQFCFVAGTPVVMHEGTLKPIERIKVGDVVLSRDENTGEVAPKPVTHLFKRQAPGTLVLTFSNGERIETTQEHPFFVEHKGFTPAGLLAIGTASSRGRGRALQSRRLRSTNTRTRSTTSRLKKQDCRNCDFNTLSLCFRLVPFRAALNFARLPFSCYFSALYRTRALAIRGVLLS